MENSTGNAEGQYQGQSEYPLSKLGLEQARHLAARLKAEKAAYGHIISSPLERAKCTAEIVAEALRLEVELDPEWMERDNGLYSGLTGDQVDERYPHSSPNNPYQPFGVTGESDWDLFLRGGSALQKLLRRPAGSYLVFSHGGLLNCVIAALLGIPPQAKGYGPRFRLDNTGLSTFTYYPEIHQWNVLSVNDTAHLRGLRHLEEIVEE